jgi:hypothetical protein
MQPGAFSWTVHKGKRIMLNSYRDLSGKELFQRIEFLERTICTSSEPGSRSILILADLRGAKEDMEALVRFKSMTKAIQPHQRRTALLGIGGVKKVLLETVNKFSGLDARAFEDRREALEWLVSDN